MQAYALALDWSEDNVKGSDGYLSQLLSVPVSNTKVVRQRSFRRFLCDSVILLSLNKFDSKLNLNLNLTAD